MGRLERPQQGPGQAPTPQIDKALVDRSYSDGTWATQMPNGRESCQAHQKGECVLPPWESCGKNHQCPRILQGGNICGGPHRAAFCKAS